MSRPPSAPQRPRVDAILLAGGRGERMGGVDKTLVPLQGRPLIAHALSTFVACDAVDGVVLVHGPANRDALAGLAAALGGGEILALVPGGARRQDSVEAGLAAVEAQAPDPDGTALVAVHDGARPLVSAAIIAEGVRLAAAHGAAIAGTAVTDTIKQVDAQGVIAATPDRTRLRAVQTPQVFRRALLRAAYAQARAAGPGGVSGGVSSDLTDDAMLVEATGHPVYVYEAGRTNLKITTPDDLLLAEALLRARAAAAPGR